MKLKDWFKFFHRFFITTGFIALFTIMCSADTGKMAVDSEVLASNTLPSHITDQCENKRWLAELLSLPNTKKILLCPDVDKILSQNSITNR